MKKSTRRAWFDGNPPLAFVVFLWAALFVFLVVTIVMISIGRW